LNSLLPQSLRVLVLELHIRRYLSCISFRASDCSFDGLLGTLCSLLNNLSMLPNLVVNGFFAEDQLGSVLQLFLAHLVDVSLIVYSSRASLSVCTRLFIELEREGVTFACLHCHDDCLIGQRSCCREETDASWRLDLHRVQVLHFLDLGLLSF